MRNNKGQTSFGTIILLFIGIIVAIALLGSIINTQSLATSLQPSVNETSNLQTLGCLTSIGEVNESNSACNITISNWVADDWRSGESQCSISSVVIANATGVALTVDVDYSVTAGSGLIQMLNTSDTINSTNGNSILTSYNYCDIGYNKDSSARSIAGLWSLFAILALVGFVAIGLKSEWF